MKNIFILFLGCLFSIKAFACDCDLPNIALELYEADYVFKGKVTQKYYSKDLSQYTITVEVIKHFKTVENAPKEFKFTLKSKHNYVKTSCDYFIDKFETLLLYVKAHKGKNVFDLMCSNSKRLNNNKKINSKELNILNNADKFDITNYIMRQYSGFTYPIPITNADSIIDLYSRITVEKNKFSIILMDIDITGKMTRANLSCNTSNIKYEVVDTIFGFNYLINKPYRKPKNTFEKTILKISKKLKYWTPYTNLKTGVTVRHRKLVKFSSDSEGKIIIEY